MQEVFLLNRGLHFIRSSNFVKGKSIMSYFCVYYTRAQNVCPGWPVDEVKQPQEKWACDFHDDALPLSFQLQVAEVIF